MENNDKSVNKRREPRAGITAVLMPFMGTRESDQGTFEYLLDDISSQGVGLSIPSWLVRRERLKTGDLVNLHLPFQRHGRFYIRGRVQWGRWDEEKQAQFCGLLMETGRRPPYPVFLSLAKGELLLDLEGFENTEDLMTLLFKDAYLLKKGILIYLKHLTPFFYRIGDYPTKQFPQLKQTLLEDIRKKAEENALWLETIFNEFSMEKWPLSEIPRHMDLEMLRQAMESEVQRDLLAMVFTSETVRPYLNAIYELEKKQSNLFNTIVVIYTRALSDDLKFIEPLSTE